MKKKLLITGFNPFGGESVNPAFEAVRLLPDEIAGFKLCKLEIPTEFIRSGVILKGSASHGAARHGSLRGTGRGTHGCHAGARGNQPDGRPYPGQHRLSADR